MESKDDDLKELKSSRAAYTLSLRKQKINEYISLKRRISSNDLKYSLQYEKIIVKPQFKEQRFNTLLDLLLFSKSIFQDKNSDINDVKFGIYLMKKTEIKNDIKEEVSKSNILKEIVVILKKYVDDIIIVDELLCQLINFTFYLKPETNMNLLTKDYIDIYILISNKHYNDNKIFNDLIILLGNLANDNPTAQKIFYEKNLFDQIYNLSQNEKCPKDKKDSAIFFLANFSKGISKNIVLHKNVTVLKNLVEIMCANLMNPEYSKICVLSLSELCENQEIIECLVTKKEIFDLISQNKNPEFYWPINKILVNISFLNEKVNLFMIENYQAQIFPYIFTLLNSNSNIMKGQGLFLLGNIIDNEPSKVNDIVNAAGFYDKIFENLDSNSTDILDKTTYIINVIVNSSDKADIFKLYQKKIHLKLLHILKNNYNREIINSTIDAIIDFLQKDTQDGIIRQSLLDNGIKDIFENLEVDRNDADLYLKTEEIIKNYF